MRTVFVNPSNPRRRRRKRSNPRRRAHRRSNPRRRRRNSSVALANPRRRRRRNAGVTPFVSQNPMILSNPRRRRRRRNPSHTFLGHIAYILGGTIGGAALNRLAFSQLENIYARNGVRVLGASILAYLGGNNNLTAAAAGAILAPLLPEIEAHLTATAAPKAPEKKNTRELAAELSALLEADLSDDELSDDDGLSDDEMSDELDDDLIDDDLIDDDLEGVGAMKW